MTYDPSIPILTHNVSTDASQMQVNFSQANTLYGLDHFAWDSTITAANRGLHQLMTFPVAQAADPALGANLGILYPKADPNDTIGRTQLYYRNPTGVQQVTNKFVSAVANGGYVQIQGGVIYMWGKSLQDTLGNHSVTFPTISNYTGAPAGFPNACFIVNFTIEATTSGGAPVIVLNQSTPITSTGFNVRVSASVPLTSIYWFAIGK